MQIKNASHFNQMVKGQRKRANVKRMTKRRFNRWCDKHVHKEILRKVIIEEKEEDEEDSWAAVS